MKERPIIMSGDNPKLILEGRKTQTRRIIRELLFVRLPYAVNQCPYGVAGDRLWVRENFSIYSWREDQRITIQFQDGSTMEDTSTGDENGYEEWYSRVAEQSTQDCSEAGCGRDEEGCYTWPDSEPAPTRLRPSIHMPRWASRITLEITKVRVERLQDISEEDAKAEGMNEIFSEQGAERFCPPSYVRAYRELWNSLHGKGEWDKNPWVWVIEFRLLPQSK